MNIGIVGLPNVGKSTLFKALTKKQIDIANYPFCTIEPNKGIVQVPDERLDALAKLSGSQKIISAAVEFVDIAGLVAGASKGEGLGNKFLSHIREVDAIAHVVRVFEDDDITHVSGTPSPFEDVDVISTELCLADLAVVEKRIETLRGKMKAGNDKEVAARLILFEELEGLLGEGVLLSSREWSAEQRDMMRELNLITLKPVVYVLNADEALQVKPDVLEGFKTRAHGGDVVVLCAKHEAELVDLSDDELAELGLKRTGLDQLIVTAYATLGLITFFTTGPMETRAWTVRKGASAPEAAGKIHSDIQDGFIRAETINWKDLVDAGSEVVAKEKGLLRLEGKEYIVKDGDVMHFRHDK